MRLSRLAAAAILVSSTAPRPTLAGEPERPAAGGRGEVRVVRDLTYYDGPGADPKKHKLDLFLPKGREGFPVVFFIHGGGWSSGDRKLYGGLGTVFA